MTAAIRAAVLDRDGTIVVDHGYLDDPARLEFADGAVEGLKLLSARGWRLVVITNQSGVGRGYFSAAQMAAVNLRLTHMLRLVDVPLEGIYVCPHAPQDRCACRKPELELMRRAAADIGFDPRAACVIGDKESDVEFGRRAGAATVLIAPQARPPVRSSADAVVANLAEAARYLTEVKGAAIAGVPS